MTGGATSDDIAAIFAETARLSAENRVLRAECELQRADAAEARAASAADRAQSVADRRNAANLEHALASRLIIEQAKGILAEQRHIDIDQAYNLLCHHCRNHNVKLQDICVKIVGHLTRGESLPGLDNPDAA